MRKINVGMAFISSMSSSASDECLNSVRVDGYNNEFAAAAKRNDVLAERDAAQADRALIEKIRAVAKQVCN